MAEKRSGHEEEALHGGADHRYFERGGCGYGGDGALRKHGMSNPTFYKWRAKYGGMDVPDARRLKQLEDENRRLKGLVADQALDIQMLKAVNAKKW